MAQFVILMVLPYKSKDVGFGFLQRPYFQPKNSSSSLEISSELFHNLNITLEKPMKTTGQLMDGKENKLLRNSDLTSSG